MLYDFSANSNSNQVLTLIDLIYIESALYSPIVSKPGTCRLGDWTCVYIDTCMMISRLEVSIIFNFDGKYTR